MILVIGTSADPHLTAVARHIESLGDSLFILDPYEASSDLFEFPATRNALVAAGFNRPISAQVKSVWWRLKPFNNIPTGSAEDLYDYNFRQREWSHFLEILEDAYPSAYWMNNRQASRYASNKIRQLRIAESVGLKIPKTLVTNNAKLLLQFASSLNADGLIFKTQTAYVSPNGAIAYTRPISTADIPTIAKSLAACPGIFQEQIEKQFELRVTIVGQEFFSAKIKSNHSRKSAIDWRSEIFSDIYEGADIGEDIKSLLLNLHRRLGLSYGAYDLIVDDNGEHIFLEVNPSGQWLWLEEAIGLNISAQIALALSTKGVG